MQEQTIDVMEDAAVPEVVSKAQRSTEVRREAFVTDGELLPWKGFWWKIHLNSETHAIELVRGKSTAKTEKAVARTQRWMEQHPRATTSRGLPSQRLAGLSV